jgi:hypothetical protein
VRVEIQKRRMNFISFDYKLSNCNEKVERFLMVFIKIEKEPK